MKIGIDTFGCDPKSGLGSYLIYFITNLQPKLDIEFELFGLEKDRYTYSLDKGYSYISVNIHDSEKTIAKWHKRQSAKFIKKNKYDIVLYPAAENYIPSKFKNYVGVAIINSIVSFTMKNAGSKKSRKLKNGLLKVQKIIAASNVVKNDLIKIGINEEKIAVIPNGIDHKLFYPMSDLMDEVVDIKPFAIKRPYFVYGSRLSSPEKKHIELIKAFDLFKKTTGLPHRLVIAGNDGPFSKEIHNAAFESEYASDIFLTGYFPHESFPKLYAGADACVFPSISEGSGLPVIEAFACGIPVICSDKGALKEISGNSAVYFDSTNVEQMAEKMQEIVENKTLREEKISEGLNWASKFNWETTVALTIEFAISLS